MAEERINNLIKGKGLLCRRRYMRQEKIFPGKRSVRGLKGGKKADSPPVKKERVASSTIAGEEKPRDFAPTISGVGLRGVCN